MCLIGARNETANQLKKLLNYSDLSNEQILNLNDLYDLFIKNNEKTVTEHKEFYKKVSSFIEKPSFSSLASELMGFNVNPAPSILKKLKEEILIKF